MKPLIAIACNIDVDDGRRRIALSRSYADSLLDAGGLPVVLPLTQDQATLRQYLSDCRGLLLPGGVDVLPSLYGAEPLPHLGTVEPEMDHYQIALTRLAMELNLPLLAICRGLQVLNVALGGSLIQHIPHQEPWLNHDQPLAPRWPFHSVEALEGSRIGQIFGQSFQVNSFHHQAVDRLAPQLEITARAPDGIVEALEHQQKPFVVAVQWHPEAMAAHCPRTQELFRRFVAACEGGR